jgi:hypothetical protein
MRFGEGTDPQAGGDFVGVDHRAVPRAIGPRAVGGMNGGSAAACVG